MLTVVSKMNIFLPFLLHNIKKQFSVKHAKNRKLKKYIHIKIVYDLLRYFIQHFVLYKVYTVMANSSRRSLSPSHKRDTFRDNVYLFIFDVIWYLFIVIYQIRYFIKSNKWNFKLQKQHQNISNHFLLNWNQRRARFRGHTVWPLI